MHVAAPQSDVDPVDEYLTATKRRLTALACATTAVLAAVGPLNGSVSAQEVAQCQFAPDFSQLRARIGPAVVGDCVNGELVASTTGDRFQTTTNGLLIHSNAGGWMAFTNGAATWINGSSGLQSIGVQPQPASPQPAVTVPAQQQPGHPAA